ncbi:MAG: tRNA preQ1(34) S-adenosylmethionine ribosyltransferase-isomerase QueA [Clostridia bacterium]|nr:tRNA preQ1(34) S-adenosylmethionine ribosyltransferase-isomerase QueA [Clostridia bacterium]
MNTEEFDYYLPEELIAQHPLADRAAARFMTINKETGEVGHDYFYNVKNYLKPGDCLVLNDTRVIPARLYGVKEGTGAAMEFLLLTRRSTNVWEVILKPGRRAKEGVRVIFGEGKLVAEIKEVLDNGNRVVEFFYEGLFENVLEELGEMPLPPYITAKLEDNEMYQTVYSVHEGSAAAPTAGLHFTPELLKEIEDMGVKLAFLTLHVGLGTFRPVKVDNVEEHKMHSEYYVVTEECAKTVNETIDNGGRVICIGTTSCRTVESAAENGRLKASSGWTDIFIYPGYKFKITQALITNFHLPKSTLIMLVSALSDKEKILNAYNIAVRERYRFFSFGDCMIIS